MQITAPSPNALHTNGELLLTAESFHPPKKEDFTRLTLNASLLPADGLSFEGRRNESTD
jgi:hypothetical protein